MIRPIIIDLPYPSIDNVEQSKRNGIIISSAYCGLHGELTTTLQYMYHHLEFSEIDKQTAETLTGISLSEMKHFEILGETLKKLGVDPIMTKYPPYYCDFYNTSEISYSKTPTKMLLDDITGEMNAVTEYKKMLENLNDENVSAIISRIILDEELHIKVLKNELARYTTQC